MKQALSMARRWCLFSFAAALGLWWLLARNVSTPGNLAEAALPLDPRLVPNDKMKHASGSESKRQDFISLDFSSANKSSMLLKNLERRSGVARAGELWFRDAEGVEWLVAKRVVHACFSPDGSKIAYSTVANELFVEAVSGERLASIENAREPVWRPDGRALSFSAVLSKDYPEITQAAIYDLKAGKVTAD